VNELCPPATFAGVAHVFAYAGPHFFSSGYYLFSQVIFLAPRDILLKFPKANGGIKKKFTGTHFFYWGAEAQCIFLKPLFSRE
jgi:hypothetical protein